MPNRNIFYSRYGTTIARYTTPIIPLSLGPTTYNSIGKLRQSQKRLEGRFFFVSILGLCGALSLDPSLDACFETLISTLALLPHNTEKKKVFQLLKT